MTYWDTTGLVVGTYSGYPYIVTHLNGVTNVNGVTRGCIARLPRPLVFIDSDSVTIPNEEFRKLEWVDKRGSKISPPKIGSPVIALYYKPLEGRYKEHLYGE